MSLKGQKSILYSHIAYQIKGNEIEDVMKSRIQWRKNFAPGACLGVTRGQKVGFWILFYCHTTPPRLFELEP